MKMVSQIKITLIICQKKNTSRVSFLHGGNGKTPGGLFQKKKESQGRGKQVLERNGETRC